MAEVSGTLARIGSTGVLPVGHRERSLPFSYYDHTRTVVGYSIAYLEPVVDAITRRLGLAQLTVQMVPVTPQTLAARIQSGDVAIECGTTANTMAAADQVAFSTTVFLARPRLLTRRGSDVDDWSDLRGQSVVAVAGTSAEQLLARMNDEKPMGMTLVAAKDTAQALQALEAGRVVAYADDDAVLDGQRLRAKSPANWMVTGTPKGADHLAFALPPGDPEFKQLVDGAIAAAQAGGLAAKIYAQWFEQPVPPKGISLNQPLGDDLAALFAAPNDHRPAAG